MIGRKRGKKIELHITLLEETVQELEALMKHERETGPSSVIDRAVHARYSRLHSEVKESLKQK